MGERVRSRIGRRKGKEVGSCWREGEREHVTNWRVVDN